MRGGRTIWVTPEHALPQVIEASNPGHLITFTGPGKSPPDVPSSIRLYHFSFNDIAEPRDGLLAPNAEHIEALIETIRSWPGDSPLVLQCWMGISRSTAAAAIALALLDDREPKEIGSIVRRASPTATPNPLMISLADHLLGLGGDFERGIKAIGRGAEAPHGEPFQIDLAGAAL